MAHIPEYRFLEKPFDPATIARFSNEDGLWHETTEDVAAGLRAGRHRAQVIEAVRRAIPRCLTARQRLCLDEHYFEGKSMRQIAREQGLHFTTVAQHVAAAIRRLRKALCVDASES